MELILLIVFTAAASTGITAVLRSGVTSRKFNVRPELEAPEPAARMSLGVSAPLAIEAPDRSHIPKEIRDELDQTPGWWDKQFHKALESSGDEVVYRELGEYIEERTANGEAAVMHQMPDKVVLSNCTCRECYRIRAAGDPEEIYLHDRAPW